MRALNWTFLTAHGRKTSVWASFYSSSWKRFEGLFLVEVTYVCLSFKHLLDLLVYQRLSSPFQFKLVFVFFSCLFSQLYITQLLLQIYCFLFPALLFFCQAVFVTVNIIKAKWVVWSFDSYECHSSFFVLYLGSKSGLVFWGFLVFNVLYFMKRLQIRRCICLLRGMLHMDMLSLYWYFVLALFTS